MINGDTLRKINDSKFSSLLITHQVKLVVITMNESIFSKVNKHFPGLLEEGSNLLLRVYPLNVAQGLPVYQRHHNSVTVCIDGPWGLKLVFVEQLHEQKLTDGGQTGKVEPVVVCTMLDVFSVLLYCAEGVPSQSCELQNHYFTIRRNALVDVGLLAHTDLADHVFQDSSLDECLQGEVIVPKVGKLVSVV